MPVDKNLFLHDLAIVAIMKNEASYVKEWIDYHLLAGADHFYIYDNDSPDNLKEVLQPYINAGLVTYTFFPGKSGQMNAYNDAVERFKFSCRYMAVIDGDEFIFPQNNRTIKEVVEEISAIAPKAAGFVANWNVFGSSYHNTADYSRGVLDRFRHCNLELDKAVKSIVNPRKVAVFHQPHSPQYFEGCYAVNENGVIVPSHINDPPTATKMMINHYTTKSREEWTNKVNRGNADHPDNRYRINWFSHKSFNAKYDDSILDYVKSRHDAIIPAGADVLETAASRKISNTNRLFSALLKNLSLTFGKKVSTDILRDKMETFLTCLALSTYLKNFSLNDSIGESFEIASLNAIHQTLSTNIFTIADIRLLLSELPNILTMPYPVVKDIRQDCISIIPQLMNIFRVHNTWREFTSLHYLQRLLKTI